MPLKFNGTDNYLDLGPGQNLDVRGGARTMTVGGWIRDGQATSNQIVASNGRPAGTGTGWYFFISFNSGSSSLFFTPGGAGADKIVVSSFGTNNSSSPKWWFVACSVSASNLHGFAVDTGGNVVTGNNGDSSTTPVGSVTCDSFIGTTQNGGGTPVLFLGAPIYNLAVWNYVALSDAQLKDFAMGGRWGPRPSFYAEFPDQYDAGLRDLLGQPPTRFVPKGTLSGFTGVAGGPIIAQPRPRYAIPDLRRAGPGAGGGPTAKTDSDSFAFTETPSIASALTSSDTATLTEATPSIGVSASDAFTEAESGSLSDAIPPPAPGADTFRLTETPSIAVGVTAADSFGFTESGSSVVSSAVAISDSDSFTFAEVGTNASGGIGNSFLGVVFAFDDDALAGSPTWTRLDDPNGTA